jgi:hypothetical protein
MAFCTNCGSALSEGARFCTGCGQPTGGQSVTPPTSTVTPAPPPFTPAPPPVAETLDYTIQGDNLQIIRVRLKPGQELYAEAGKMIYKQPQVIWETRMSGATIGERSGEPSSAN